MVLNQQYTILIIIYVSLRSLKRMAIAVEQAHRRLLTVNLCGKPHPSIGELLLNTWARHNFVCVVSWCPLFGINFVLKSHIGSMSLVRCPESRSVYISIKLMLDTIRNTMVVRYREAILFSEGQLRRLDCILYTRGV